MKLKILALFIFFFGCQVSLAQADYIQGQVVRVDRQKGEVVIALCAQSTGGKCCRVAGEQESASSGDGVVVTVIASWLPRCLSEGMMIFARGSFSSDEPLIFEAVEVFPRKKRGGKDTTGVRSRFHHGWGYRHHGE